MKKIISFVLAVCLILGCCAAVASAKGEILVCRDGAGVEFSEERAKEILLENEITIQVSLHGGSASATAWGCDLTYDYVRINGDYRT